MADGNERKKGVLRLTGSGFVQLLTNLIPVFGVLKLGWSVSDVILIYLYETVLITLFTLIKGFSLLAIDPKYLLEFHSLGTMNLFIADVFAVVRNPFRAVWILSAASLFLLYFLLFFCLFLLDPEFPRILREPVGYILNTLPSNSRMVLVSILISQTFALGLDFFIGKNYRYLHPFPESWSRIALLFITLIIGIELQKRFGSNLTFLIGFVFLKIVEDLALIKTPKADFSSY